MAYVPDADEDERVHLEVLNAHMRRAAKEVMLEETHGRHQDIGCQLSVAMSAMRCFGAGDREWAIDLVRCGMRWDGRGAGQDRIAAVAATEEGVLFRYLEDQLSHDVEASDEDSEGTVGQHKTNNGAHLLRMAAAWRQRRHRPAFAQSWTRQGGRTLGRRSRRTSWRSIGSGFSRLRWRTVWLRR